MPAPGPAWDLIKALADAGQVFEEDFIAELLLHSRGGFVLPSLPNPTWFKLIWFASCGADAC